MTIKPPKDYVESERVDVISKLDDLYAIKEEIDYKREVRQYKVGLTILLIILGIGTYLLLR
jgi:hypothetical protein